MISLRSYLAAELIQEIYRHLRLSLGYEEGRSVQFKNLSMEAPCRVVLLEFDKILLVLFKVKMYTLI